MFHFILNYHHMMICIVAVGLSSNVCANSWRIDANRQNGGVLSEASPSVVDSSGAHVDNRVSQGSRNSAGQMAIHFQSESMNLGTRACTNPSCKDFRAKELPSCMNADGFCDVDPEYDTLIEESFSQILQRSNIINEVFSDILIESESPFNMSSFIRSGAAFLQESPTCLAFETLIYPKRGRTDKNDFVFILNQGDTKQGIRVEKCIEEGSLCQFGGGGLPQTTCRQKYIYKKMLTIDHQGTRIVPESILMPSCCICYVQQDFVQTRTSRNDTKLQK